MHKQILTICLLLVMIPSLAACAKEPSAQEIVDSVVESLYDVSSYQFRLNIAVEAESEETEVNRRITNEGTIDITNRLLRSEIILTRTSPGEEEYRIGMEEYIIGNIQYTLTEYDDIEPVWEKERMPVGTWIEINQVESQIELLKSANIELLSSEKIRGVDCYVLKVIPNSRQLWEMSANQMDIAGGMPDIEDDFIDEIFRRLSCKYWIDKDTYLALKSEIEMDVEITLEMLGAPAKEGTFLISMVMTLDVYNYNVPVSIVLPTEAEEAMDVAQQEIEAEETELANVQAAVIALMVDNELSMLPNPVTSPTNDMSAFPDSSICGIDKILGPTSTSLVERPPERNPYILGGDKDGYILYQHDLVADGKTIDLVDYVTTPYTWKYYAVDAWGNVTQYDSAGQ